MFGSRNTTGAINLPAIEPSAAAMPQPSAVIHETQKTTGMYRQHTRGIAFFDGVTRHVLTTRRNGAIRFRQIGRGGGLVWISKG